MNVIPLDKDEFDLNKMTFQISQSEKIDHVKSILKLDINQKLKLCLIDNSLAIGLITIIDKNKISGEILEKLEGQTTNIQLFIGACRPPTVKKLLEHGTTMGVSQFNFFPAKLSEKSYLDSNVYEIENCQKYLNLGLAQSNYYFQNPQVNVLKDIRDIESESKNNFVLDLKESETFNHYHNLILKPVGLAIGPERGWTEDEIEILFAKGFLPVSIGNSILRVEHAVYSALSQIQLLRLIK